MNMKYFINNCFAGFIVLFGVTYIGIPGITRAEYGDDTSQLPVFLNWPHPLQATAPLNPPNGYIVFKLHAVDPDGPDNDIIYKLGSDAKGRFELVPGPEGSGAAHIRTKGTWTFIQGEEFILMVSAINTQNTSQRTIEPISIIAGERPPQFLKPKFYFYLEGRTPVSQVITALTANSFQRMPIHYELLGRSGKLNDKFSIDGKTGEIFTLQSLRQKLNTTFHLVLYATELNKDFTKKLNMTSKAEINIDIVHRYGDTVDGPF